MQRRTFLTWALCGCTGLLTLVLPLQARRIPTPLAIPERVALADAIVLGKVTAIEADNVAAIPHPGVKETVPFQVAVIKVEELFHGDKGLTHIRLGFQQWQTDVTVGLEACFFLKKHCTETFFVVIRRSEDTVPKTTEADFAKKMTLVKQCVRLLADPDAGLKSKDADERLLTAVMLVARYRIPQTWKSKPMSEPIAAEQSRLILRALAEADWSKASPIYPQMAFTRLALTDKDGWKNPTKPQQYVDQAKQWLKDNADTYRLHRFVD